MSVILKDYVGLAIIYSLYFLYYMGRRRGHWERDGRGWCAKQKDGWVCLWLAFCEKPINIRYLKNKIKYRLGKKVKNILIMYVYTGKLGIILFFSLTWKSVRCFHLIFFLSCFQLVYLPCNNLGFKTEIKFFGY